MLGSLDRPAPTWATVASETGRSYPSQEWLLCSNCTGERSVPFVFSSWCRHFRRWNIPDSVTHSEDYSRFSFFFLNLKWLNGFKKFGSSEQRSWRWFWCFHCVVCVSEFVFYLDASDEFLKDRVKNLPESLIQERNYEQEPFLQRLAKHREEKLENKTALEFFDELDISPVVLGDPWNCISVITYS